MRLRTFRSVVVALLLCCGYCVDGFAAQEADGNSTAPKLIDANCAQPEYPVASTLANEHGAVVVKLSISKEGAVSDAQVDSTSGYARLDDSALQAVRGCRFEAATQDGKAVAATKKMRFVFKVPPSSTLTAAQVYFAFLNIGKYIDAMTQACSSVIPSASSNLSDLRRQWHANNDAIEAQALDLKGKYYETMDVPEQGASRVELASRLDSAIATQSDAAASKSVIELQVKDPQQQIVSCKDVASKIGDHSLDIAKAAPREYAYLQKAPQTQ